MKTLFAVTTTVILATGAVAQEGQQGAAGAPAKNRLIEQALSAAPPQLRGTATVKDLAGTVLRQGTGDYTCFPAPEGIAGPMCMDDQWLAWMEAWMNNEPTNTSKIGIAYMLAGDSATGGASNIDPAATKPTADNDWVVEGPHLMILVPDESLMSGLPTTPVKDGPYVMWSGTPYAHIMVPVEARPEQRTVSAN